MEKNNKLLHWYILQKQSDTGAKLWWWNVLSIVIVRWILMRTYSRL